MDSIFRQRATLLRRCWIAVEMLLIAGAFVGAYYVRGLIPFRRNPVLYPLDDYLPLLLVILPLFSALLYRERLYHTQRVATLASQWGRLAKAHVYGGLALALVIFATRLDWVSRSYIFLFLGTSHVALGLERTAVLAALHAMRRRGRNTRNALVVGTSARATDIARAASDHAEWGLQVLGFVSVGHDALATADTGTRPVLGEVGGLPEILESRVVDEIIFCVSATEIGEVQEAMAEAELRGINVRLVADFIDMKLARTEVGYLGGLPVLTFTTLPQRANELLLKRILDVTLSSLLLLVSSPLMALSALAIRMSTVGPIIYRQMRVGQNGRRFTLYKFRTMHIGAERVPAELRSQNEMNGPVFKLKRDPRVTAVGRILRRWSLDELPQFWNVVRGDMSLVGPRPPLPEEVDRYETWQRRRLSMKPGMTGLWQVSGRNEIDDFSEWMRLDLDYIDNWTLKGDLGIIARTVTAVLSGRGAF